MISTPQFLRLLHMSTALMMTVAEGVTCRGLRKPNSKRIFKQHSDQRCFVIGSAVLADRVSLTKQRTVFLHINGR